MEAAAHTPGGYGGVSQAVGKEFVGKDDLPDWLDGYLAWALLQETNDEEPMEHDSPALVCNDEFKEGDHPRAENGQFGSGSSGSSYKPAFAASKSKKANAAEAGKFAASLGHDAEIYHNAKDRSPAYWHDGKIKFNSGSKFWADPVANMAKQHELGFLASPDPSSIVHHEIGHKLFDAPDNFMTLDHQTLAGKVSKYAKRNPKEFVSETHAGLSTGKTYPDDVMNMFKVYAKPRAPITGDAATGFRFMAADKALVGPFATEEIARRAAALLANPRPAGLAYDKSARTIDADGRMHLDLCNISKAMVSPYKGSEIPGAEALGLDLDKVYQLLRDPGELEKAAATFNNLPLMIEHVPVSAEDHPSNLVVGTTGSVAKFVAPYLVNSLAVWTAEAIDEVESEAKKELSCGYHYTPDMTPGEYEGVKYDGVMRNIIGNHVSLVKEGRAGPDVVVSDSKTKETDMKVKPLSRTAVRLQAAFAGHFAPMLAADKKLDLFPILTKVTAKGLLAKDGKTFTADAVKLIVKLAKDAAMPMMTPEAQTAMGAAPTGGAGPDDAMIAIINALAPQIAQEVEAAVPDEAALAPSGGTPAEGEGKMDRAKLAEFMTAKGVDCTDEELDALMGAEPEEKKELDENGNPKKNAEDDGGTIEGSSTPGSSNYEPGGTPANKGPVDSKAKDAEMKNMVSPKAMDAALAKAKAETTALVLKTQREIRDAEHAVEPFIGKIAVAQDSAASVYKLAFDALGVKVEGVDPSAYPAILALVPKPDAGKKPVVPAMDAKAMDTYSTMFGADRVAHL